MNKRYLYALPLAFALAACSGQSIAQECKPAAQVSDEDCTGDPSSPEVIVSIGENGLQVDPMCVNTKKGKKVVFRVSREDYEKGDIFEVFAKDDFDTWLKGKNDTNARRVFVDVPGTDNPKKPKKLKRKPSYHDYGIRYKGYCIDPRIKVER